MCVYVQLSPAALGSPKRETPASHIGIIQTHTSGTAGCGGRAADCMDGDAVNVY